MTKYGKYSVKSQTLSTLFAFKTDDIFVDNKLARNQNDLLEGTGTKDYIN